MFNLLPTGVEPAEQRTRRAVRRGGRRAPPRAQQHPPPPPGANSAAPPPPPGEPRARARGGQPGAAARRQQPRRHDLDEIAPEQRRHAPCPLAKRWTCAPRAGTSGPGTSGRGPQAGTSGWGPRGRGRSTAAGTTGGHRAARPRRRPRPPPRVEKPSSRYLRQLLRAGSAPPLPPARRRQALAGPQRRPRQTPGGSPAANLPTRSTCSARAAARTASPRRGAGSNARGGGSPAAGGAAAATSCSAQRVPPAHLREVDLVGPWKMSCHGSRRRFAEEARPRGKRREESLPCARGHGRGDCGVGGGRAMLAGRPARRRSPESGQSWTASGATSA